MGAAFRSLFGPVLLLLVVAVRGSRTGVWGAGAGAQDREQFLGGGRLSQRHLAGNTENGDDGDAQMKLSKAITDNDLEGVRAALEAGADPSELILGFNMGTPLHIAVSNGKVRIVKLLLKAKAKVNERDRFLSTPLHYAAGNGFPRIAKLLIRAKADLNAVNSDQSTPLHVAARNGFSSVIKVLIESGADINALDSGADTALHQAAENGHVDAVKTLLELGSDPSIEDEGGQKAVDEICEDTTDCSDEVIATLRELLS